MNEPEKRDKLLMKGLPAGRKIEPAIKEMPATKMTESNKSFHKRYFALQGCYLFWYKNSDADQKARGYVQLSGARIGINEVSEGKKKP